MILGAVLFFYDTVVCCDLHIFCVVLFVGLYLLFLGCNDKGSFVCCTDGKNFPSTDETIIHHLCKDIYFVPVRIPFVSDLCIDN